MVAVAQGGGVPTAQVGGPPSTPEDWELWWERVRDTVRFLKSALAGEKISEDYETFSVKSYRLGRLPAEPPNLSNRSPLSNSEVVCL